jgi:putative tryptophan/tyrosine transport system substrate-binding protein
MMDRRKVLRALFGSAIAAITMRTGTDAQQAVKVWRIGVVGLGPPTPEINDALAAFRRVLTEHGHQVTVEYRWPEPDPLLNLADEIIAFRFDVLVFWGERALRTLPKRSELLSPPPAVFALYNELRPHDVLWQFSIDRGIAGVSATRPTLISDQVRILKDVVPSMSRLAILWDQSDPGSLRAFNEAVAEANAAGVRPQGVEGRNTTQLESAFGAAVSGGANALIVIASATSISHATTVVALAARYRLPAIYSLHEFVEVGGLISYGASFRETLRRAAAYVDRIVKGGNWPPVRPRGTLPIEPPPKLEFVVNRKTAKALGLTIPPSLLARADQIIE